MADQERVRTRGYRMPLPPHAIASRQAHRVLEWALEDWNVDGTPAENTRIVLSELVTNALTHSLDVFRLSLHLGRDRILVEVSDRSDEPPQLKVSSALEVNGRGMLLVEALCGEWGVRHETEGGKTVWASIAR